MTSPVRGGRGSNVVIGVTVWVSWKHCNITVDSWIVDRARQYIVNLQCTHRHPSTNALYNILFYWENYSIFIITTIALTQTTTNYFMPSHLNECYISSSFLCLKLQCKFRIMYYVNCTYMYRERQKILSFNQKPRTLEQMIFFLILSLIHSFCL